jgi:Tol biopolymer transport system component
VHLIRIRAARLPRLVIGLLLLLVPSVSGAVYGIRTADVNGYACLLTTINGRPNKLFDLRTGARMQFPDRLPDAPPLELRSVSPDETHVAYLKQAAPGSDHYTLWVEEAASGRAVRVQDDAGVRVPGGLNGTSTYNLIWAPDGSRFAYLWAAPKAADSFIVTAKADGSDIKQQKRAVSIEGWSADSAHLAFVSQAQSGDVALSLWSFDTGRIASYSLPGFRSFNAVWSPERDRLAYLETPLGATPPNLWLTIVSVDRGLEGRVSLMPLRTPNAVEVGVPQWSPDGRYVTLTYKDQQGNNRLDMYGIDGSAQPGLALNMPSGLGGYWAKDSRSIGFADLASNGSLEWRVYHLDSQKIESVVSNIVVGPYAGSNRQVLVGWRDKSGQIVELISIDGTQRVRLAEGAGDTFKVGWSPDGRSALAAWFTGQHDARRAHLSVMRTDGAVRYTVDGDWLTIRDVTWLNSGAALAYIADGSDGKASAGLIDLRTGEHRALLTEKPSIVGAPWGLSSSQVAFLWKGEDGNSWLYGFDAKGTQVFTFRANRVVPDKLFLSPDRRTAVLKTIVDADGLGNFGLMLSSADGTQVRMIRSGLVQVDDVYWSPDAKMLAFTQIASTGVWTLEVVTIDGATVQTFQGTSALPEHYEQLLWTQCDPVMEPDKSE